MADQHSPAVTALVGATGGAGTTVASLALAQTLAADGARTVIIDTAVETQGLAAYVPERIDPDLTTALIEGASLETAIYNRSVDGHGRVAIAPTRAPFSRLARAKAPETAQRLEAVIGQAADTYAHVVVDTPPIGSNLAVAVVNSADTVGVVAPASDRGVEALYRMEGRIQDINSHCDLAVGTPTTDESLTQQEVFDIRLPEFNTKRLRSQTPMPMVGGDTSRQLADMVTRQQQKEIS